MNLAFLLYIRMQAGSGANRRRLEQEARDKKNARLNLGNHEKTVPRTKSKTVARRWRAAENASTASRCCEDDKLLTLFFSCVVCVTVRNNVNTFLFLYGKCPLDLPSVARM